MSFNVVIPARYASTRLTGKLLLDIVGKPMIIRVAEQAVASGAHQVCVATDHQEILDVVLAHGFNGVMTRADHVCGTDRIVELVTLAGWSDDTVVVNVQGDEPMMEPELIAELAHYLETQSDLPMATACYSINDLVSLLDPNIVKVVLNKMGRALYFSRAAIPCARQGYDVTQLSAYHWHIGIYAYRVGFLKQYAKLEAPDMENIEFLEQLRALWHGYPIGVLCRQGIPPRSVDTPEDLHWVRTRMGQ